MFAREQNRAFRLGTFVLLHLRVYVDTLRPMKRTNVFLKSTQIRELKAIARETGATVAGLIRKAIDEFIGHHKAEKAKVEVNGAKNEKSE